MSSTSFGLLLNQTELLDPVEYECAWFNVTLCSALTQPVYEGAGLGAGLGDGLGLGEGLGALNCEIFIPKC